jgi:hypothetical protein
MLRAGPGRFLGSEWGVGRPIVNTNAGQEDIRGVDLMRHLGDYFRARRLERAMNTSHLAQTVGYKNLNKGRRRIQTFEGGGKIAPDLLEKLASALAVSQDEIRRLAAEDYKDWLRWAEEPVRPYVLLRYMACVYQRVELPDDALTPEAAEEYASRLARERKFKVCLVLSRRISVWYDATGKEYARTEATPRAAASRWGCSVAWGGLIL